MVEQRKMDSMRRSIPLDFITFRHSPDVRVCTVGMAVAVVVSVCVAIHLPWHWHRSCAFKSKEGRSRRLRFVFFFSFLIYFISGAMHGTSNGDDRIKVEQ